MSDTPKARVVPSAEFKVEFEDEDDEQPIIVRLAVTGTRREIAALLLNRAKQYQRDAGVIRRTYPDQAVAYETVAAELRKVAEEVGK